MPEVRCQDPVIVDRFFFLSVRILTFLTRDELPKFHSWLSLEAPLDGL